LLTVRHRAWDVGTGNGQAALGWVPYFEKVIATDASAKQLNFAPSHPQIEYQVCAAEKADSIVNGSIHLISVAQALHWFDFDRFYKEVTRVAAAPSIVALWSYRLCKFHQSIDEIIQYFYDHIVGPYWEKERDLVDEGYRSVPFPFETLPLPKIEMKAEVSLGQVIGYLQTWSATQKYIAAENLNPVAEIENDLKRAWGDVYQLKTATYPLTVKVGRIA
jgi:hypothetical protein